jgi:hypothetical protein
VHNFAPVLQTSQLDNARWQHLDDAPCDQSNRSHHKAPIKHPIGIAVPPQTNTRNGHRPTGEIASEPDPHVEIARLEAEIEERSEAIERCRKVILLSKIAAIVGGLVIVLILTGTVPPDATALIVSIAAALGGAVGLGSTTTTATQLAAAIKDAESRRAELIGMINLTVVGEETTRH